MDLVEVSGVVVGVLGSGGIGAVIAKYFDFRRAATTTAPDIIGTLMTRVTSLEDKAEKKDGEIDELQKRGRRCERKLGDAKRVAEACEGKFSELARSHGALEAQCAMLDGRLKAVEGK